MSAYGPPEYAHSGTHATLALFARNRLHEASSWHTSATTKAQRMQLKEQHVINHSGEPSIVDGLTAGCTREAHFRSLEAESRQLTFKHTQAYGNNTGLT
jgi:hypothetical protein